MCQSCQSLTGQGPFIAIIPIRDEVSGRIEGWTSVGEVILGMTVSEALTFARCMHGAEADVRRPVGWLLGV